MDNFLSNGTDEKDQHEDPPVHINNHTDSPEDMSDAGNSHESRTELAANGASHMVEHNDDQHSTEENAHDESEDRETEEESGSEQPEGTEDEDQDEGDGGGEGEEDEYEDDDEEDEEDEDEDEDEDDEEPALKYERLGGITHNLLQKDSASALAYSNQRFVSGCAVSGLVKVFLTYPNMRYRH